MISVLLGPEACSSDAWSTTLNFHWFLCGTFHSLGVIFTVTTRCTQKHHLICCQAFCFQCLEPLGETEVTGGALFSRDEKKAWEQDARSSSALCPFLSGLKSGYDPCSSPHSHPQLFREHLGCPAERLVQDCCVSLGEASGKSSGSLAPE